MLKNVYEIFQEFEKAKDETARRKVLVDNRSESLVTFLQLAFDPRVKFLVTEIPKYRPSGMPPGMGYTNMGNAVKKTYLFIEGHPKRAPTITEAKSKNLLINILESLEDREALMYIAMLQKKVKIKNLTPALIEKTFPNIFNIPIKA